MLLTRCRPDVPKWIREPLRRIARALEEEVAIVHDIRVDLIAGNEFFYLQERHHPDGTLSVERHDCYGVFSAPEDRSRNIRLKVGIAVGGRRAEGWLRRNGMRDRTRADRLGNVLLTFCHELVHYEQWRDGREPDHRGVDSRARAMASRVLDRIYPE
jgi:hypothetical protein